MTTRVSLAELAAADIQLHPAEAVAVAAEICRQYTTGLLPGIPSPGIIRVTRDGQIVAEGPMTTDDAGVARAAHLLQDLLPDFEAPAEYRASGGLRLVIARALGTLDLPSYNTLEEFCAALGRFAVEDLGATARGLFRRWEQRRATPVPASPSPELTISDIRRARRATGWSLDDVSAVADVPASRLRDLEWGYFLDWRGDEADRAQVVRYARATGLDEQIVLSIAWPMIEEASAASGAGPAPVTALVPAGLQSLTTARPLPRRHARWGLAPWGAAAAVALMTLGTFAMVDSAQEHAKSAVPAQAQTPLQAPTPDLAQADVPDPPVPAVRDEGAAAVPVVAATARPAARQAAARPASSRARRPATRHRSFFERELFRIHIK